ncbi:hypothetical protein QJQ45_005181 [Haematococcus lacustris]|nr:hypothetical protein QJQ45_005181 [Haematococcus lacustris]
MKWVSRQHYHQERGCFSQGGWKAKAVREGFRKVVEQPNRPSTDPRPDRLVIVDKFRTSRVSSSVHARHPCELHLLDDRPRPADWVPPAGQVNQRLVRPAWSLRHAKLLDRDTNACFNFQRNGESMQCPMELCSYEGLEALPPVGKEYQQRYQRTDHCQLHQAPHSQASLPAVSEPKPSAPKPDIRSKAERASAPRPRWPPATPHSPHAAARQPHSQQPQNVDPALPRQPSTPRLSRQLSPPAKPAPQPGRWLDRDCKAALNMQRIGESRWRALELCYWPDQGALPAKGKEYPGLGYKRVRDRLPKAQQLQQPAEAQ